MSESSGLALRPPNETTTILVSGRMLGLTMFVLGAVCALVFLAGFEAGRRTSDISTEPWLEPVLSDEAGDTEPPFETEDAPMYPRRLA